MDTSLTPEVWERSAVLMVAAMAVTFVLTAALDALALRRLRRRASTPPTPKPHGAVLADRRTPRSPLPQ
ncbi:hypothetical protein [Streptomyces chartreusis]|uniref:hypothetical protein n=1 Tax=Streptomyces chartreusis TaxID=1969 RepID=UPI00362CC509